MPLTALQLILEKASVPATYQQTHVQSCFRMVVPFPGSKPLPCFVEAFFSVVLFFPYYFFFDYFLSFIVAEFLDFINNLTDPEWIVAHGGLYLLLFIIFAETGIFIGFFLPGDPILFIAGIIIANIPMAQTDSVLSLLYWILLMSTAGILGNFVGYWTGKRFGHFLLSRKDTWIFKKKHLDRAAVFYHRRGGGAIILARFLPVVRTFAPVIAGMVNMQFRKFTFYNVVGGTIWVGSLVTAGYLLGENEWVKSNLEYVIIGIVLLATAPVISKIFKREKVQPDLQK